MSEERSRPRRQSRCFSVCITFSFFSSAQYTSRSSSEIVHTDPYSIHLNETRKSNIVTGYTEAPEGRG